MSCRHFTILILPVLILTAGCLGAKSGFGGDRLSKYANHPAFRWQKVQTEHFTVYYESGSATVPRLGEMKTSIERSRTQVLRLMQISDFPDRIHVFLVDSLPRTKELRGSAGYGGAIAKIRTVFAVVNATNNGCSTHEFCHVIASAAWGKPERWLDEGLASYSDERWAHRNAVAARLAADGRLLPLATLARDFLQYPEEVTYIEASSFVGFVIERYGLEKFKQVWKGGFKSAPKILGRSLEELEAEWRASLPTLTSQPTKAKAE